MTDLAVVGMSCRFPGAPDVPALWRSLLAAEPRFDTVPRGRWNHAVHFDAEHLNATASAYTDQVSFLDSTSDFSPEHYGIPPLRAKAMDPQQRLLVDLAREALQDAGWDRGGFDRSTTGVFAGLSSADYRDLSTARTIASLLADGSLGDELDEQLLARLTAAADRALDPPQAYTLAGCLLNMAACAVNQAFDLRGPSFVVDAACASTLTALEAAAGHLGTGSCSVAVVGGVYLSLTPSALVGFSRIGALSRAGMCRPFDVRADGFVLGEGGAVVVLRPLSDALAAGDRVYAVVRGIGSSNDGAAGGVMTPAVDGQLAALEAAYADAGGAPDVDVLEAHGTGTTVGDRTEVEALGVFRERHGIRSRALLGSAKEVFGHSLSAAGALGLVKAALQLHEGVATGRPAGFRAAALPFGDAGLDLPDRPTALTGMSRPLRAGVSSFGFGGSNVHVVLESFHPPTRSGVTTRPHERGTAPAVAAQDEAPAGPGEQAPWLLLASAGSADLLAAHAEQLAEAMATEPALTLARVAATLGTRRQLATRLAVVASTREEAVERLRAAAGALRTGDVGEIAPGCVAGSPGRAAPRIAFVYPGQGSQRVGMLADVVNRFPVARELAERTCPRPEQPIGSGPLPQELPDLLWGRPAGGAVAATARLTRTEMCQPALGTAGVVLTRLLDLCGVHPDVVVGHSVGEFPAAVAAGVVHPQAALGFLVRRGAAIGALGHGDPRADAVGDGGSGGGMLAVRATPQALAPLLAATDGAWLGCHNAPDQVVATGRLDALVDLAERCAAADLTARHLQVSHAFHSPLVAHADQQVEQALAALELREPTCDLVSTVSGDLVRDAEQLRDLWQRHSASPVRFCDALRTVHARGVDAVVQVYGGTSTWSAVRSTADPDRDVPVQLAATGADPDDGAAFLRCLGRLAVAGVDVTLAPLFDGLDLALVTLPPAPLATRRFTVRRGGTVTPGARITPAPANDSAPPSDPAPRIDAAARTDPGAPTHAQPRLSIRSDAMDDVIALFREQVRLLAGWSPAGAPPAADAPMDLVLPSARSHALPVPAPGVPAPAVPVAAAVTQLSLVATDPAVAGSAAILPASDRADIARRVVEGICAVSAYRPDAVRPDTHLTDDLGFDSLMIGELVATLRRTLPGAVPQAAALAGLTTVASLVDALAGATDGPAALLPAPAAVQGPPDLQGPADAQGFSDVREPGPIDVTGPPSPPPPAPAEPAVVTRQVDISTFPEVKALAARRSMLLEHGARDPYFLVHEGTIGARSRVGTRDLISFSSYNYLGLSGHPQVQAAVGEAVARYGSSVSAARILSGERPLHTDLDRALADLVGAEDAVTLVSGHGTNMGVIGHLTGAQDLIVHDALAHDSIIQGCRLSDARRQPFPHSDVHALDALLAGVRSRYRRVLVVVEGVYSMDGDIAPLPGLIDVARRHDALLMVDEAHSIGVLGATGGGIGEHFDVDRGDVDIWMGTLSKSLASCGGYLAGRAELIHYLRYTLPGFIYSAGLTPANAAAALAATQVIRREPDRVQRLRERGRLFVDLAAAAGLDVGTACGTPVVPCIVGDSLRTLALAEAMFDRGVSVNPILHPAVEERATRLRFFVTAEHSKEQIRHAVAVLAEEAARLGVLREAAGVN